MWCGDLGISIWFGMSGATLIWGNQYASSKNIEKKEKNIFSPAKDCSVSHTLSMSNWRMTWIKSWSKSVLDQGEVTMCSAPTRRRSLTMISLKVIDVPRASPSCVTGEARWCASTARWRRPSPHKSLTLSAAASSSTPPPTTKYITGQPRRHRRLRQRAQRLGP